jgi:membrane-associated protease RseP (regulator of RpoE activity)
MFSKSFMSVMIVTSAFTLIFGQTPETRKDKETMPQAFAWSFDGEGSYLGIEMQEVNKENFAKFGLRDVRGIAVVKVEENSPAATAGIRAGDVIVRLNGEEITSTRKLTRLIGEIDPDHQAKVTVLRNDSEQELTATLAKRQGAKFESGNFEFHTPKPMDKFEMPDLKNIPQFKDMPDFKNMPQWKEFKDMPELKDLPKDGTPFVFTLPNDGEGKAFSWRSGEGRTIGIGVTPLTKQLAEHFGVEGGVMIGEVRENSPASKAGLKAGDIVVEANGKAVNDEIELIRLVNDKKEGDITLTIVRDGKRQTKSVTPEASKDGGFLFKTNDKSGWTTPAMPAPPSPMAAPAPMINAPAKPMATPAPMVWSRPGRISFSKD